MVTLEEIKKTDWKKWGEKWDVVLAPIAPLWVARRHYVKYKKEHPEKDLW